MSYVGRTQRHFCTRVNEHLGRVKEEVEDLEKEKKRKPIMIHAQACPGSNPSIKDFKILSKVQNPDIVHLSIMEALFIREEKPKLNTKDEFRNRLLRIKV